MGRERFYEHTNIYAIEEELNNIGVYNRYDSYWKEKEIEVENLIREQRIEELQALCHDFTFYQRCHATSEFAELFMAMEIYEEEIAYEENKTIFWGCTSMRALREKMSEVKYVLFRIEFTEDEENYTRLLSIIAQYGISATFLQRMVKYICYGKTKVALALSRYFVNVQLVRYAQAMLMVAKENEEDKE